jgi:hypothetical protein
MRKSYRELQKLLTFDNLMTHLAEQFSRIKDHRRQNTTYSLADVLQSAFAMFSLKSPSLLSFQEQTHVERENLKQIFRLRKIPADSQMRATLDKVEPRNVRALFAFFFSLLRRAGVIQEYEYWNGHLLCSIDGVEHFSSSKIHCRNCTTKERRDGTISYQHSALAAVLVHPQQKEVLPIDFEPIVCQDGAQKNDCERVAATRLIESLKEKYPAVKMLLVEDALYACRRRTFGKSERQAGSLLSMSKKIRTNPYSSSLSGASKQPRAVSADSRRLPNPASISVLSGQAGCFCVRARRMCG